MDLILATIVSLMRKQFRLVAALCTVFAAGLLWFDGFTAGNIAIALALLGAVGLFYILVSFWSAIFDSMRSKGS